MGGQAGRDPEVPGCDLGKKKPVPEMFQLWGGGAPFEVQTDGTLRDRSGRIVRLMGSKALSWLTR